MVQLAKEIAPWLHDPAAPSSSSPKEQVLPIESRTTSPPLPQQRPGGAHFKHKRKISRHLASNIHWTERNGKMTPVLPRSSTHGPDVYSVQ